MSKTAQPDPISTQPYFKSPTTQPTTTVKHPDGVYTLNYDVHSTYLSYNHNFRYIPLTIGEQMAFANLDYFTSEIIVADSECGIHLNSCKRYCQDDKFRELFCPPICVELNKFDVLFYCPYKLSVPPREMKLLSYNSFNSTTHKPVQQRPFDYEWKTHISGALPTKLYGQYALETFSFYGSGDDFSIYAFPFKDFQFKAEDLKFVRGLMVDSELFINTNLTIGMLPSKNNLFVQLHERNVIRNAQISFWLQWDENHVGDDFPPTNRVTLGDFEKNGCQNWIFFPLNPPTTQWTINMQKVTFGYLNGKQSSFKNLKVYINPEIDVDMIIVTNRMMQQLVEDEVIFVRYNAWYYISLNSTFQISLTNGEDKTFHIDPYVYFRNCDGNNNTLAQITVGVYKANYYFKDAQRYNLEDYSMVLGSKFFSYTCYGFDYTKMKIGFGNNQILQGNNPFEKMCRNKQNEKRVEK